MRILSGPSTPTFYSKVRVNPAKKLKSKGILSIRTGNAAARARIGGFLVNDFGRQRDFLIKTNVMVWYAGSRDQVDTGANSQWTVTTMGAAD
jgi:hypothetical protein